ncbi:sugar transferase [Microcoleus sp. FACHB-1515]|uniref:Npun_R2821/Npun_R2822 family protein n=1 Tax=Cyanophyceae TaxID=3028117 RepID=UPI00168257A8|nr:Npun_R2821/Npun_R2822 family protein [Microcoleus sp. FACHB-1515]MBD2091701.1 sugar transferase [Microcoleus sp. FACHB-1515]
MRDGIYTLANDAVYDQLVALLNSIEANAGRDFPICVIAYDNRLDKIRAEISNRSQVTLLEDPAILQRWRNFSLQVWQTHSTALQQWQSKGIPSVYRLNCNHRYAAFDLDAPFDRFLYLDADTLLLNSPKLFFENLDCHDFVTYDFQFKDPSHIFNLYSEKLGQCFSAEQLKQIFCSGCFAARRGLFSEQQRDRLIQQLAAGESEVLYLSAPNQSVLNYMALRSSLSIHNLALHLPESIRTGNAVTSTHFEQRGMQLFDRDRRLTYLHYIGLSPLIFQAVCRGENLDFPYRNLFLDYRYFHQPNLRPRFRQPLRPHNALPSLPQRVLRKIGVR